MEFLTKIYWANFFPWAEKAKKGGTRETGPARPPEQGGLAGQSDRPRWAPAAFRPGFSLDCSFSTSFFG
jgi:hypothetical protein